MLITILIIIVLASFFYLAYLIARHFPDLKNINVESIAEEKQDAAKVKILEAKFARQGTEAKKKLGKIFSPAGNFLARQTQKWKKKIAELEVKYYTHAGKAKTQSPTQNLAELFRAAGDFISQGDWPAAEKKLIDIIAQDKKNIRAYELLGDLYFDNKNYDQAEEILRYLIKLQSLGAGGYEKLGLIAFKKEKFEEAEMDFLSSLNINNQAAVYYDDLVKVYEATGKNDKALDACLKASSIEPNNPKYLDKLVELSIKIGDRALARKTFNHLKKINPENAKLAQLQESIEKI